jgi:hypothetical protein
MPTFGSVGHLGRSQSRSYLGLTSKFAPGHEGPHPSSNNRYLVEGVVVAFTFSSPWLHPVCFEP